MKFPYDRVLVVDTETANTITEPLPYDISYTIIDINTKEVLSAHAFVVAEIYLDKDLMNTAYYAKKIPLYERDLASGKRTLARLSTIQRIITAEMQMYNVEAVGAYNMNFDKRALNKDERLITSSKYRWFFPYGTEFFCIWAMACSSILRSKRFIQWAIDNACVSACGNIQTSAEVAYRYITKDIEFNEDHMGLEDVAIETEILFKILRSGMRFTLEPSPACWRQTQSRRKELELEIA